MRNIINVEKWTNLVVFCSKERWIETLTTIWDETRMHFPRYYEVRCSFNHRNQRYLGLDFRFFSQKKIEKQLSVIMSGLGFTVDDYCINPKLRTDKRAKQFADCSGSYKGVSIDEKHTPEFLNFLSKVSDLAVEFLTNLETMTSSHPESEEPRNEVSHLFRIMMGIQDGLDWDLISDNEVVYSPVVWMQNRLIPTDPKDM